MVAVSRSSMAYPWSHRSTCFRVSTGHCRAGCGGGAPPPPACGTQPVAAIVNANRATLFFTVVFLLSQPGQDTAFPHATQNFHPASTSEPHAGQFFTCKF